MASSAQSVDQNGFLLIKGCPLSSYGIFDYGAGQVGDTTGDPMRVVKVFRPKEEVNNPKLIESLKSMPWIDDHDYLNGDPDASDADGMAPEEKGVDGVITDNVYWDDPWLRGDLKVFSRRLRQAIQRGKKDLSLGYTSRFTYAPGVFNGQPYEYVQTDMLGNHIALVTEGRVAGARVLDGRVFDSVSITLDANAIPSNNTQEDAPMENETQDGNPQAELQAALQALLPKIQAALASGGGEGAAAPAPGGEGEASAEPPVNAQGSAENGDTFNLSDACAMLDELLPKLKEKAGMGQSGGEAGAAAPGTGKTEGGDNVAEGTNGVGEVGDNVATGENGLPGEVEGAQGTGETANGGSNGVSEGPKKGTNTQGGDSAMRKLYADMQDREKYYGLISAEVGTFDHSQMTASDVIAYGAKKLGLKGEPRVALDSYFLGKQKGAAAAKATSVKTGDSAASDFAPLAAYLNQ
jgi:hypothetical protein